MKKKKRLSDCLLSAEPSMMSFEELTATTAAALSFLRKAKPALTRAKLGLQMRDINMDLLNGGDKTKH